jgi:uncharacterized membrane protein YsdA (DUF1294 family)
MFKVYAGLVVLWGCLLGWAGVTGVLPTWVLLGFAAISILTLGSFWVDKWQSKQAGERRIPEHFLHSLELLGGWPASLLGQTLFRHKTTKRIYQYQFGLMVIAHLTGLIAYLFWIYEPPAPDSPRLIQFVGRLVLETLFNRVVAYYLAVQLLTGVLGWASTLGLISPDPLKTRTGRAAC